MFRFLHTADLHLDAPLKSLALKDPELSEIVGSATRQAFEKIVETSLEEEVDALLIAGDLNDGDIRSMKTAAFLAAQMERLNTAGIPVFMIRGNHDAESVITRELSLPPNVHVFTGHGGSKILEAQNVAIHGVSFAKPHAPESLLPKYPPPEPGHFNIGLLHTSLAGSASHDTYAPCSVSDLVGHGYDYWALGHVHIRTVHHLNPYVVMPGMPQGRDIGEAGAKSATLVSVDDTHAVSLQEIATSAVEFQRTACSLEGLDDLRDGLQRIKETLNGVAQSQADHVVVRLSLTGATPLAWQLRRDLDLLNEQVSEIARALGRVWIDKIVLEVERPAAIESGTDARRELHAIMADLRTTSAFQARVARDLEELVGDLPPEIRGAFGADENARRDILEEILSAGIDTITARMMADAKDGDAP